MVRMRPKNNLSFSFAFGGRYGKLRNMAKVIESMTRVAVGDYIIRVWRNEPVLDGSYDNSDIKNACLDGQSLAIDELAYKVSKMSRVNAVEVLYPNGDGVLIYPEWP